MRISPIICLLLVCFISIANAQEETNIEDLLHVQSSGYSRAEINGRDVIIHFTESVTGNYGEISFIADDLKLNRNTNELIVEGNVELAVEDLTFKGKHLVLDGQKGTLNMIGPITGRMDSVGCNFIAGNITGKFSPDEMRLDSPKTELKILDGVELTDDQGRILNTSSIEYSGENRCFQVNSEFTIEGDFQDLISENTSLDVSDLIISGQQLNGEISDQGNISAVLLNQVQGMSSGLSFYTDQISIQPRDSDSTDNSNYNITISPLIFKALLNDQMFNGQSAFSQIDLSSGRLSELRLIESVRLLFEGIGYNAEEVRITSAEEGVEINFPGNVAVDFNLADLVNIDPLPLERIRK